ncbi:hypothetical protein B0H13DRAFT_1093978 [Mycena leptocephala]|nr:hypothetical protein B0H13DRAFT_1093978 [Mycena leptocephala]
MSQDLGPNDPLNYLQLDGADTDTAWNTLQVSSMWPPVDDFALDFGLMDMSFDPALNCAYLVPDPFQFTSTSESFSPYSSAFEEDPATELANRVRKAAGVILAIEITQDQQQEQQEQQQEPQLAPPQPALYTPPPPAFTTTPVPAVLSVAAALPPRPKTSHSVIERRYRTNLNARIQSLCQAVPALRVVDRSAAMKAGKPIDNDGPDDIVDARGFVDGVKVARKCSKANVLGKAVEYIRVLKSREARLAREIAGLKTLLVGLVGGRSLLHEWEREWAARFGGPETDEVSEDEPGVADEDAEEDEESDRDADRTGAGRKRKKRKVDPKSKPERSAAAAAPEDGEKKKRGRPRPVVPLPASAPAPVLSTFVPMPEAAVPQRQHLLAAFALFSFFANPNLSAAPQSHHAAHEGHVLTYGVPVRGEGTLGLLPLFYLLVNAAMLASLLLPVGKSVYTHLRGASAVAAATVITTSEKQAVSPPTPTSEADAGSDLSLSSISGDDEPAAVACILEGVFPFLVTIIFYVIYYFNSRIMQTRLPQRVCAQHWLCVTVYKLYIFLFLSSFFGFCFAFCSLLFCFVEKKNIAVSEKS